MSDNQWQCLRNRIIFVFKIVCWSCHLQGLSLRYPDTGLIFAQRNLVPDAGVKRSFCTEFTAECFSNQLHLNFTLLYNQEGLRDNG